MNKYTIDYDKRFKRFQYLRGGKVIGMSDILETLNYQENRIAELEQEKEILIEQHDLWKSAWCELNQSLESRDLEQQANGVGAFEKLFSFYEPEKDGYIIYAEDAISYCAILREQAKQLKGGAE